MIINIYNVTILSGGREYTLIRTTLGSVCTDANSPCSMN